jgi:hypothetical protein
VRVCDKHVFGAGWGLRGGCVGYGKGVYQVDWD